MGNEETPPQFGITRGDGTGFTEGGSWEERGGAKKGLAGGIKP